jgi:DNA repair protein RecO (recombination protein O)
MHEKARAVIVRRTLLTDTSLIIHWCSAEHGLFQTIARGARRPGSPFGGKLDLFYNADIDYVRAKRGTLHTLREVSVTHYREGLQRSYLRVLAAAYFTHLIETVAERDVALGGLYDVLVRGLDWLVDHEPTPKGVTHYERLVAEEMGVHGELDVPPIAALGPILSHLPPQRADLMRRLGEKSVE